MITEALVIAEPGAPMRLEEVLIEDEPRADEVMVQMKATGVCHTDLNFQNEKSIPGLFPAVLGHEGAGIVAKVGANVASIDVGDHVLITYTCCGDCKYCMSKETSFCREWEQANFGVGRRDGSKAFSSKSNGDKITSHFFGQSSFARYAIVMARSIVKVEKDLPLEKLAPLGCGIMTGAGAMLSVIKPKSESTVAVVGVGAVGLAAMMALQTSSSRPKRVIAVDIVPERLEMAKRYGATHVVNSREKPDLRAALMAITDNEGVDGSIDTTGRPAIVRALLDSVAKKGVVVTVGVGELSAEVSANIFKTVNSGRSYVGCCMGNCYPQEFIPMLIGAWRRGQFPFTDLIHTYPAAEIDRATKDVLSGRVIKAVLVWESRNPAHL